MRAAPGMAPISLPNHISPPPFPLPAQPHLDEYEAAIKESSHQAIAQLIAKFAEEEGRLRERCLELAFNGRDDDGNQNKRGAEEACLPPSCLSSRSQRRGEHSCGMASIRDRKGKDS